MGALRKHQVRTGLLVVTAFVALGLLLVPVEASYLERYKVGLKELSVADCGAPIASLLGTGPGFHANSKGSLGAETAPTACEAASGKRASGALVLLLAVSMIWGRTRRAEAQSPSPTARIGISAD